MKPIKIGKYTVSWKFILLIAITLFIIYMRMQAQTETVGIEDTFRAIGLIK
jgi:hypothetical protein